MLYVCVSSQGLVRRKLGGAFTLALNEGTVVMQHTEDMMLYDPKWQAPAKQDIFSLESLIAWLEQQNPNESYCYTHNGHCLIAQYLKHHGYQNVIVGGHGCWWATGAKGRMTDAATIARDCNTFGGALWYARKVLKERQRAAS